MTCQDCGLTIEEEKVGNSKMLALELESLTETGRCFACEFMRRLDERIIELKGENDERRISGRIGTPFDTAPSSVGGGTDATD